MVFLVRRVLLRHVSRTILGIVRKMDLERSDLQFQRSLAFAAAAIERRNLCRTVRKWVHAVCADHRMWLLSFVQRLPCRHLHWSLVERRIFVRSVGLVGLDL
jgi:hypothetical protein